MKKLSFLLFFISWFLSIQIFAQSILTFNFDGLDGNEITTVSNFNHPELESSIISHGPGIDTVRFIDPGIFNGEKWTTNALPDLDDYFEFTITPNSGIQFSLSSIIIRQVRNGSGPLSIVLRTNTDGYSTNQGGIKTVPDPLTSPTLTTFEFFAINISSAFNNKNICLRC